MSNAATQHNVTYQLEDVIMKANHDVYVTLSHELDLLIGDERVYKGIVLWTYASVLRYISKT